RAVGISGYFGDGSDNYSGQIARIVANAGRWLSPPPPCGGTSTATATPAAATATPTCVAGVGTPGPWTMVATAVATMESPAVASNGTYLYSAGGFTGTASNQLSRYD